MYDYTIVDVFTGTALQGNPVAVFHDASTMSPRRMQQIANEMHLSETTFLLPPENGGDARVRIFTPVNELPFAGHPALGTAIVLGQWSTAAQLRLETAMGTVPFDLDGTGQQRGARTACMRQPIPTYGAFDGPDDLLAALGLSASTVPVEVYRNGPRHVYVGVESIEALSRVRPDLRALARYPDLAVNCFAGAGVQWRMRMFSPAYGVDEDAATGSAAGPLAVHLARHGLAEFGRWIHILQGVDIGRPSTMHSKVDGTGEQLEAVHVSGEAIIIGHGTLDVDGAWG